MPDSSAFGNPYCSNAPLAFEEEFISTLVGEGCDPEIESGAHVTLFIQPLNCCSLLEFSIGGSKPLTTLHI